MLRCAFLWIAAILAFAPYAYAQEMVTYNPSYDVSGREVGGAVNASGKYFLDNGFIVTPALQFSWHAGQDFIEMENLSQPEKTENASLRPGVGFTAGKPFAYGKTTFVPYLYGRIEYELGNAKSQTSPFSFSYEAKDSETGRGWISTGLGVALLHKEKFSLTLGYDAALNRQVSSHTVSAAAHWKW